MKPDVEGPFMKSTLIDRIRAASREMKAAQECGDGKRYKRMRAEIECLEKQRREADAGFPNTPCEIFIADYDAMTEMQDRILKYQEQDKAVLAILDEFDYAEPSSRFCKDIVMGRVNRIIAILEGKG